MDSTFSSLDKSKTVFCNGVKPLSSREPATSVERAKIEENSQHPGIYLTFGDHLKIICPYCSHVFHKIDPN